MTYAILGLLAGIVLSLPIAWFAVRRREVRVRRLEQRARGSERLAELGRLTGGLAHEIKNPLSTVGLNIQLLQEDLAEMGDDATPQQVEKIGRVSRRLDSLSRETQRLRDILEDFLQYAGRIRLNRVPTNINHLLGELVDFFEPQAQGSHVNLRPQLTASPEEISIDADLVKQAVLNLLLNACQAMNEARDNNKPSGGNDELIIRTENKKTAGQNEILIHVIDTGPGIEKEKIDSVFAPYFSSKKSGSGLGLPTSRRIIEEHGGTMTVHSEQGRGTDFTITLPNPE